MPIATMNDNKLRGANDTQSANDIRRINVVRRTNDARSANIARRANISVAFPSQHHAEPAGNPGFFHCRDSDEPGWSKG